MPIKDMLKVSSPKSLSRCYWDADLFSSKNW